MVGRRSGWRDKVILSNHGIRYPVVQLGERPADTAVIPNGLSMDCWTWEQDWRSFRLDSAVDRCAGGESVYYPALGSLLDDIYVADVMPTVDAYLVGERPMRECFR